MLQDVWPNGIYTPARHNWTKGMTWHTDVREFQNYCQSIRRSRPHFKKLYKSTINMHIGSKVQISINKPLFKSLITSVTPILSIFSRKCSLVKIRFYLTKNKTNCLHIDSDSSLWSWYVLDDRLCKLWLLKWPAWMGKCACGKWYTT